MPVVKQQNSRFITLQRTKCPVAQSLLPAVLLRRSFHGEIGMKARLVLEESRTDRTRYFGASPIIVYGTAKHAVSTEAPQSVDIADKFDVKLVGLMRSVASVSKPLGVRINLVAPWMTGTCSSFLSSHTGERH